MGGVLQPEPQSCIWRLIADVPQAIEAVRKLYSERELGRRLGINGRTFVEKFNKKSQMEKWHRVFQRVTGRAE